MYQALYRKYRPQTFQDVVGQNSVTDTLRAQLMTGKYSHAYLFTGTRGTGKTSCAKILAKAVNCTDLQDGSPCNRCAACRAIDSGSCMDVLEIDAASNNGVDSVRTLRDDAIYSPSEVKMRVYIVDEVHMLSTAAFNALLKIIEEPPEHLMFILATTELHKVPATILSRCQRFAFRRPMPEDIVKRLNYIAYQEGIEIEPAALELLGRLADGSFRDGVSLLDQCATATLGPVTEESVYQALGLAGQKQTAALLSAVADRDSSRALSIFSALYSGGKDLGAMLDELVSLCRDLLILKTAPKSGLSMLSGVSTTQEAQALLQRFSAGELMRLITILQTTAAGFLKTADARVAAELCILQLCEPQLNLDVQAINARLSKLEEAVKNGVQVQSEPMQELRNASAEDFEDDRPPFPDDADDPFAPPPSEPAQGPETAFWPELSAAIRDSLGPRDRGFFTPDGPIQPVLSGDTLTFAATTQFVLDLVKRPEVERIIKENTNRVLGRPVAVRFALADQVARNGHDPMDALIAFGDQHQDIFTIR